MSSAPPSARILPTRILIVDDDEIVREIVATFLRESGMTVIEAAGRVAGLAAARAGAPDLVLVDINLPDGLGFDLVQDLRARGDVAIIHVTSRDGAEDRLRGLDGGADDYVVKPFDLRELLARIRAVTRRFQQSAASASRGDTVVAFGGWSLDLVRRELCDAGGAPVHLTRAEFDLFAALYRAGRQPLHRDFLVEVVAAAGALTKARTVDVLVSRIRRKLEHAEQPAPRVVTRAGEGYLLHLPDSGRLRRLPDPGRP